MHTVAMLDIPGARIVEKTHVRTYNCGEAGEDISDNTTATIKTTTVLRT